MLQLKNRTPFVANMSLFPNEQGIDTLYLMVKASFKIGVHWMLADEQMPLLIKDEYWGEPNESSIKYASDYHISKPFSDIVIIGNAYTQGDKWLKQMDVNVSVGNINNTIRIFGDRIWQNGVISQPKSFQVMPLIFEKAFGGHYFEGDEIFLADERNPLGCGFAGKRTLDEMNGIALPNLENPDNLIRQYKDEPEPACFAFISPGWKNRHQYAGTYNEQWAMERAPYLPIDFDCRFFNMAHPQLIYPEYLQGGEAVSITNMHENGNMQFNLPMVKPIAEVNFKANKLKIPFNLETLLIQPNKMELNIVWRAAMPCDKAVLKIKEINIALLR